VHTRSQVSLGAFHAALTVGGPGGTPRPIEMHAHDPLRYVGDMLAWLHQAVASEYELLNRVFGTEGSSSAPISSDCPSPTLMRTAAGGMLTWAVVVAVI
jgi:hypothetical protein